jgi:hypothetical protein
MKLDLLRPLKTNVGRLVLSTGLAAASVAYADFYQDGYIFFQPARTPLDIWACSDGCIIPGGLGMGPSILPECGQGHYIIYANAFCGFSFGNSWMQDYWCAS